MQAWCVWRWCVWRWKEVTALRATATTVVLMTADVLVRSVPAGWDRMNQALDTELHQIQRPSITMD